MSFVAGLDRFENLGLTGLDLTVDLKIKRARWYRRLWRRFRAARGAEVDAEDVRYRLAGTRRRRRRNQVTIRLKVGRSRDGQWSVDTVEIEQGPEGGDELAA